MNCPVISLAQQLISIPSISPTDGGCQKIIADRLSYIGFKVIPLKRNNTSNLLAYKGNGKTLSFAGHTDVVPVGDEKNWKHPPFIPIIQDGYLFGRGAVDMKGSLAAMIIAAENFIYAHPNHLGRLSFLITSDEESSAEDGTIRIIEYLQSMKQNIDYCIVGEPTSNKVVGDIIKIGRRGSLNVHLVVYGVQGHIAYPEFSKNPIHLILSFLKQITNMQWSTGNKYFVPTSLQISNIFSGIGSENVTPKELMLRFNFRFGTDITVAEIKEKVISLLAKCGLEYSITWKLSGEPFVTHSKKLIDIAVHSIYQYNHLKPILSTSGGTSDGRFIKNIASEIIELGPVNNMIHKVNECVKITDLQILSLMYQSIMEKILI
ncbi:succinyl-diaminopimelate desuccinylase [Buchnera aphidicola]|uniref:succinyl-diaminopimelate desuccinylase n=1 Tax=Buchnera aphidicola TaxID=9 RepID=UPI003463C919